MYKCVFSILAVAIQGIGPKKVACTSLLGFVLIGFVLRLTLVLLELASTSILFAAFGCTEVTSLSLSGRVLAWGVGALKMGVLVILFNGILCY